MSLTADQITPGATYAVRFEYGLSGKRFRDAVKLVKEINDYATSTSSFDTASKTWTVTLGADADGAKNDLYWAVQSYGAIAERA